MRQKQSPGVQELHNENKGGWRERERVRQTARGWEADGDMLIYELQGFSLTRRSFTETERGGEKDREKHNMRERERDAKFGDDRYNLRVPEVGPGKEE